jgi:hypothetical protein
MKTPWQFGVGGGDSTAFGTVDQSHIRQEAMKKLDSSSTVEAQKQDRPKYNLLK